jgi:PEGA domain
MHMRPVLSVIALALVASCGSIIHGRNQEIGIASTPVGARVTIDNQTTANTPFVAKLSRKNLHSVKVEADGYAPADLTLTRKVSGWAWGNIVFGGLIGLAVDAGTGGLYKLTPEQLNTTLATKSASISPSKDGIYVVLVPAAPKEWTKVGQLIPLHTGPLDRAGE